MSIRCTRCADPAESVMSFDYSSRAMWLDDIPADGDPGSAYPLCAVHAVRMSPPLGWTLTDRRSPMARLFAVPA
jgi:hypothetical protein